jgi:hypothetical protein
VNARLAVVGLAGAALVTLALVPTASAEQAGRLLREVRTATAPYQDLDRATADGFGVVTDLGGLTCIDNAGTGAMGTHYALPSRLLDGEISALEPEILLYDETGDLPVLVGVEYVVLAEDWHARHGAQPPKQLGKKFTFVAAGNRYGLPDFYQQHVWLWETNPLGLLQDWNPEVGC